MACLNWKRWKRLAFSLLLMVSLVSTVLIGSSFRGSSAAPAFPAADVKDTSPPELLQAAMVENMQRGTEALAEGSRRKEAMVAIDEAHRIAKVGEYAESADGGSFSQVSTAVEEIWRRIQNGQPEAALARLREAIATLEKAPIPGAFLSSESLQIGESARLLNAYGQIVGDLEKKSDGTYVATVGGWQNVLGFLKFGGTSFELPADRLVFGKQQLIGYNFVALADSGSPNEIIRRYSRQSQ